MSMSSAGTVVRVFRRGCAALSSFSRMTGADRVRRDRHALAVQRGGGRAGTRRIMSEAPSSDSTIRAGFLLLTFVAESGRPSRLVVSGLRAPRAGLHMDATGQLPSSRRMSPVALAHRRSSASKAVGRVARGSLTPGLDRKSTRLNSSH